MTSPPATGGGTGAAGGSNFGGCGGCAGQSGTGGGSDADGGAAGAGLGGSAGGGLGGSAGGATMAAGGAAGTAAGSPASSTYAINPAHDGLQATDEVMSPLERRWSVNLGGPVYYPVIADGRIFLSYEGYPSHVAAYDLETGSTVWGPIDLSSPVWLAYDAGILFGFDQKGVLSAWSAASGAPLWSTQLTGQWVFEDPPVATGGLVYLNGLGNGGTVYALDGADGTVRWQTDYFGGQGAVAVDAGIVYQVGACQWVEAFDAITGTGAVVHSTGCYGGGGAMASVYGGDIWVRDQILGDVIVNGSGTVVGSFASGVPAFHGGTVFYNAGRQLSAVDISSGATKWSYAFASDNPNEGFCTPPVVAGAGRQVFMGTNYGKVVEIDESSGAGLAVVDTGLGGEAPCWPMALAGGHLAFATGYGVAVY